MIDALRLARVDPNAKIYMRCPIPVTVGLTSFKFLLRLKWLELKIVLARRSSIASARLLCQYGSFVSQSRKN